MALRRTLAGPCLVLLDFTDAPMRISTLARVRGYSCPCMWLTMRQRSARSSTSDRAGYI